MLSLKDIKPKNYEYIKGSNETVDISKDEKLEFEINIDFEDFMLSGKVYIDGEATTQFAIANTNTNNNENKNTNDNNSNIDSNTNNNENKNANDNNNKETSKGFFGTVNYLKENKLC